MSITYVPGLLDLQVLSDALSVVTTLTFRLYKTLCRPILEYGFPGWMPYQQGHIQSLEKVQKRLARSCIPAPRGEVSYASRLQRLELCSVENRFKFLTISYVSKCLHGVYDVDPFNYISVNTRHSYTPKFHHNFARTDCFKYNVFNRFPVYFDDLPPTIKDKLLFSLPGFLSISKKYFTETSWLEPH